MSDAAPSYFGADLDRDALEVLSIARIDRKLLKAEPALYASKWFDYRQLHPAAATYLFAHHFQRAYQAFWTRALDAVRGAHVRPLKGDGDVMQVHETKSFWRLRQKLDELGMRYDFFLTFAVGYMIEVGWGTGTPHPPRPAQLLRDHELIVAAINAWEVEQRGRIQWAADPHFSIPAWRGTADQLAWEGYIVGQIKRRQHPHYALSSALYERDTLRIEAALEHFEAETIAGAIELRLAQVSQE